MRKIQRKTEKAEKVDKEIIYAVLHPTLITTVQVVMENLQEATREIIMTQIDLGKDILKTAAIHAIKTIETISLFGINK